MSLILLCVIVLTALLLYTTYVSLIKKRNKAMEAFSSVDVQLKKRYDLIPNILTIAQKFMDHERKLIEDVTKLSTRYHDTPNSPENVNDKISLSSELSSKLNNLFIAVENYPQLKSDTTMITAIQTYNDTEEHIAAARRFYNSAVNDLKNAVEIFPSSLIASMLNIKAFEFFKAEESEKKSINAADYLK